MIKREQEGLNTEDTFESWNSDVNPISKIKYKILLSNLYELMGHESRLNSTAFCVAMDAMRCRKIFSGPWLLLATFLPRPRPSYLDASFSRDRLGDCPTIRRVSTFSNGPCLRTKWPLAGRRHTTGSRRGRDINSICALSQSETESLREIWKSLERRLSRQAEKMLNLSVPRLPKSKNVKSNGRDTNT
jgi:hypothetical protein